LAVWYTISDICLIWQVVYYKQYVTSTNTKDEAIALINTEKKKLFKRRVSLDKSLSKSDTLEKQQLPPEDHNGDSSEGEDMTEDNSVIFNKPKIKPIWVNLIGSSILISLTLGSCYAYYMMIFSTTTVEPMADDGPGFRLIPQLMGWSSAVLYVGSRVPQLIKNWRQQSTDGLSSGMFICAVFGNAFFTLVS
jgi:hypothetical protein